MWPQNTQWIQSQTANPLSKQQVIVCEALTLLQHILKGGDVHVTHLALLKKNIYINVWPRRLSATVVSGIDTQLLFNSCVAVIFSPFFPLHGSTVCTPAEAHSPHRSG